MNPTKPRTRERNPRGEGSRLREEIVLAATALLEHEGREDAVTLRAVAREVGISAPSIYAHFDDREAILDAVVELAFVDLTAALIAARDRKKDPVQRLHAGCAAYVRFARERPDRYRVLFGRQCAPGGVNEPSGKTYAFDELLGAEAFGVLVSGLVDCVDAGRSLSQDPHADATMLWSALHGYATLRAGSPDFPWPADRTVLTGLIERLALLTA